MGGSHMAHASQLFQRLQQVKATAPAPKIPAPDKAAVIAAVYAAQTEEEVVARYKKNSYYFGKDEAVITACSQRKQQLKQG